MVHCFLGSFLFFGSFVAAFALEPPSRTSQGTLFSSLSPICRLSRPDGTSTATFSVYTRHWRLIFNRLYLIFRFVAAVQLLVDFPLIPAFARFSRHSGEAWPSSTERIWENPAPIHCLLTQLCSTRGLVQPCIPYAKNPLQSLLGRSGSPCPPRTAIFTSDEEAFTTICSYLSGCEPGLLTTCVNFSLPSLRLLIRVYPPLPFSYFLCSPAP